MKHPAALDQPSPHVLVPWIAKESMTITAGAAFLTVSEAHMRRLAARHDLGRKIPGGSEWRLSRVALRMFAEHDHAALRAYLQGDRQSPLVRSYFSREGLTCEPLPKTG